MTGGVRQARQFWITHQDLFKLLTLTITLAASYKVLNFPMENPLKEMLWTAAIE